MQSRSSRTLRVLSVAAGAALVAGCSGQADVPARDLSPADTGSMVTDGGRGPASRGDTGVVVVPYGSGYLATETLTFANDTAGASRAIVTLATAVGDVGSSPGAAQYQVAVSLQATGHSEAEARKSLASMTVSQTDQLAGGVLQLGVKVAFQDYQPPKPGSPNVVELNTRSASIQAALPATLAYALNEATDVGNATSTGLSGSGATLSSDVGDASLDGTWSAVSLATAVGDARFAGDTRSLRALSDVGSVYATLAPSAGLDASLATNVGDVDAGLAGPAGGGFDLYAATTVGSAVIAVHGTEPVGKLDPTRAHWQTPGYASLSPKVHIEGESDVGSVLIHD